MARKTSKRWVEEVEKVTQADIPQWPAHVRPSDAVKLLSRQHEAFVRMVKRLRKSQKFPPIMQNAWYQAACDDILAALHQGGKR